MSSWLTTWGIKKQGLKAVRGQSMSCLSSHNHFGQYIWARYLQALRYLNSSEAKFPRKINTAVDLPPPSAYRESRHQYNTVPVFPFCSGNYTAPCTVGSQKMSWVNQNGKHGSFINGRIDFMHNISGQRIQRLCSPPTPRSVLFWIHSSGLCWDLRGLSYGLCSYWSCVNPLISLVGTFYFYCIPLLLSFILPVFQEYYGNLLLTHIHREEI